MTACRRLAPQWPDEVFRISDLGTLGIVSRAGGPEVDEVHALVGGRFALAAYNRSAS